MFSRWLPEAIWVWAFLFIPREQRGHLFPQLLNKSLEIYSDWTKLDNLGQAVNLSESLSPGEHGVLIGSSLG